MNTTDTPPSLSEHVAKQIYAARLAAGLSRAQLAHKLGISSYTIKQYEHAHRDWGTTPSLNTLAALGDALGVTLTDLLP